MGNVMNLGRLLSDTARRLPGRTALVWGKESWTWAEMDARVNVLVAALRRHGLGKGDPILVQARNSNQLFESLWAAFKLGAVWVPTNYRLTPPEVAYLATSSGAKALIYDDAFPDHADAVQAASETLKLTIAIGSAREGELSFDTLVVENLGAIEAEAEVDHGDPC